MTTIFRLGLWASLSLGTWVGGAEWIWGEDGKVGFEQTKVEGPEGHPGGGFPGLWGYQNIGLRRKELKASKCQLELSVKERTDPHLEKTR